jgi:RNA polymerase sporulation-specific sigma factor
MYIMKPDCWSIDFYMCVCDFGMCDDAVLWEQASHGDAAAETQLIEKYSRLVRACARPYFLTGGETEDLIQEGMLGLISAVRQYDPSKTASFRTFAEHCIRNRLYTAIKSASRLKHTPLNDSISFESPQFDESQARVSCYLRDPEELLIAREHFDELTEHISGSLSNLESEVLELYLSGLSYHDIAKKLNKAPKSVDNAVQRIRKKLAQCLTPGVISEN